MNRAMEETSVYMAHNSLKKLLQYSKGLTPTVANAPRVCLSFDFKLGQIEALLERTVVDYRYSNTNTDTRKALLSILGSI